jgi:hypothetical protein
LNADRHKTGPDDIGEQVVAALEDHQRRTVMVLRDRADDPEAVVMALVRLHLEWTEEDRERAIMVGRERNAVAAGPLGERLAASNREWFSEMKAWIDTQAAAGRIKPVSFNLLHAVVFAPTQEIAKLWLTGRLKRDPTEYAEPLGRAAWASVKSLPARQMSFPETS